MGRERRQAQRRERQRRRRGQSRPGYEPVGQVRFTGIMGLFQRRARILFVGGILVMIVSLGAIFFPTSAHTPSSAGDDSAGDPSPTATVEATATPEGTPTEESEQIQRLYQAEPAFEIDGAVLYEAVIQTERGPVRIELLAGEAPNISYVKSATPAVELASSTGGACFLMQATTMQEMRAVCNAGELMPQKSTYFYPKLASGLVVNPLDA